MANTFFASSPPPPTKTQILHSLLSSLFTSTIISRAAALEWSVDLNNIVENRPESCRDETDTLFDNDDSAPQARNFAFLGQVTMQIQQFRTSV